MSTPSTIWNVSKQLPEMDPELKLKLEQLRTRYPFASYQYMFNKALEPESKPHHEQMGLSFFSDHVEHFERMREELGEAVFKVEGGFATRLWTSKLIEPQPSLGPLARLTKGHEKKEHTALKKVWPYKTVEQVESKPKAKAKQVNIG
jgi:hypothetical protein